VSRACTSIACSAGPPRNESFTGRATRVATKATEPSRCRLTRPQVASMYRIASSIQNLTQNERGFAEILFVNGDDILRVHGDRFLVDFRPSIRIVVSMSCTTNTDAMLRGATSSRRGALACTTGSQLP
jgi:hypothetical protein